MARKPGNTALPQRPGAGLLICAADVSPKPRYSIQWMQAFIHGVKMQDFRKVWRRFWQGPDAAMLVAGGEGERQVANVRVVVVALLLITPIYRLAINPTNAENIWGFAVTVAAMLFALYVFFHIRSRPYRPWLGFLTATLDGSLVSLALTLFVF